MNQKPHILVFKTIIIIALFSFILVPMATGVFPSYMNQELLFILFIFITMVILFI